MAKYRIKDICDSNFLNIKALSPDATINYLDTSSITDGVISKYQTLFLNEAPSRAQRMVSDDTIIYSLVRPNLCHYGYISQPIDNLVVSTGFITLNVKPCYKGIVDSKFLYLLLTQPSLTSYLHIIAQNAVSAYPSLNPSDIEGLTFDLPEYNIQKSISSLFFNINSKIALNREINRNLEAMARQLYDYWFVQFDFPDENGKPYKSSGGRMVWNEKLKREIPEGWNVECLGQLSSFRNGINYSKDEIGKQVPIVNVRNISSTTFLLDGETFDIIEIANGRESNYIISSDDIIIARSGCPGATRLLLEPQDTLFCGFIICCTPNQKEFRNIIAYRLKQLEGTNATTSGGSILQNVSQDTLKRVLITAPSEMIIRKFNQTINLILTKLLLTTNEINALLNQRDELLPLLMNGQVSVMPTEVNCGISKLNV